MQPITSGAKLFRYGKNRHVHFVQRMNRRGWDKKSPMKFSPGLLIIIFYSRYFLSHQERNEVVKGCTQVM
jgi:hypothetical protein